MKFLRDPFGRPIKRLYFSADELDERCERKIADFMDQHCRGFRLPIPTGELNRAQVTEREVVETLDSPIESGNSVQSREGTDAPKSSQKDPPKP